MSAPPKMTRLNTPSAWTTTTDSEPAAAEDPATPPVPALREDRADASVPDVPSPSVPWPRHLVYVLVVALSPVVVCIGWLFLPPSRMGDENARLKFVLLKVPASGLAYGLWLYSLLPLVLLLPFGWHFVPAALAVTVLQSGLTALGLHLFSSYKPSLLCVSAVIAFVLVVPVAGLWYWREGRLAVFLARRPSLRSYNTINQAEPDTTEQFAKRFGKAVLWVLILSAHICWSLVFGSRIFPLHRTVWQGSLMCASYPIAVAILQRLMGPLHLHKPMARLGAFMSQGLAAFPYRLIFPSFTTWSLGLAILGVEVGYKLLVYNLRALPGFWSLHNKVVTRLRGTAPAWLPIPEACETPEAVAAHFVGLSEKFFFHQLVDFVNPVALIVLFATARARGLDSFAFVVNVPEADFRRLLQLYAAGAGLEIALFVLIPGLVWLCGYGESFRPLQHGLPLLRSAWFSLAAMLCTVYLAVLLYVTSYAM